MTDENNEIAAADKFFDEAFGNYQRDLHGSEAEVVVMKRVATYWYRIGRLSMLDDARRYHQQALKELEDKHFAGVPIWLSLPKPYA